MKNPWEEIPLSDYENHMKLDSVMQLQTLNAMMKQQFYQYPVHSIMILGAAGGNGLQHIDPQIIRTVFAVDINQGYLDVCTQRYPELNGILEPVCTDLTGEDTALPQAELVVADLLIEYIGYLSFQKTIRRVRPQYVSCIIQINTDTGFVSDSPYLHVFDDLDRVHHQMDEKELTETMVAIGYGLVLQNEQPLPNSKKLVRLDFEKK